MPAVSTESYNISEATVSKLLMQASNFKQLCGISLYCKVGLAIVWAMTRYR